MIINIIEVLFHTINHPICHYYCLLLFWLIIFIGCLICCRFIIYYAYLLITTTITYHYLDWHLLSYGLFNNGLPFHWTNNNNHHHLLFGLMSIYHWSLSLAGHCHCLLFIIPSSSSFINNTNLLNLLIYLSFIISLSSSSSSLFWSSSRIRMEPGMVRNGHNI